MKLLLIIIIALLLLAHDCTICKYHAIQVWKIESENRNKMRFIIAIVLVLNISVSCVLAFSSFKKRLPNGIKVIAGSTALGHANDSGGGTRNVFGQAFSNAGLKWTKALCLEDTDGDGQTNGLELGDPNCCWVEGDIPLYVTDLSHPGKANSKTQRTFSGERKCQSVVPSSSTSKTSNSTDTSSATSGAIKFAAVNVVLIYVCIFYMA